MQEAPPPTMSLAVVGADFDNPDGSNRRFSIALCAPGDPVYLRPEPTNPVDPRAIAVFNTNGMQMGYIAADRASRVGALISEGREWQAVFQRASQFGAWIRMSFDGEEPALTPAMTVSSANPGIPQPDYDSGFYPDEIWPDD